MATELDTFGQRILTLRERRGMGRAAVAAYADYEITKAGLFRIETESRVNPKLTTLIALSHALGLRIEIDPEGVIVEAIDGWAPPGRLPEAKEAEDRQAS